MSNQVKVEDLQVFSLLRAAMLKFAQGAGQSLSNADSDISRTHSWLEGEQASYWQGQLRKRTEAVAKARDVVRQKKMYKDISGRAPDASQEEKALAKCIAAVEVAQRKIDAVRKWLPRLEKAADQYRSGVSRLNNTLAGEIPKAIALLDRLAMSLEQYVQIEAPSAETPAGSAAAAMTGESMSRGNETSAQSPATPATQISPPSTPPQPPSKENRNVIDGQ